uniref:Protein kinase domain-containing protein n=1 Tax=Kalanchoe fedtschenkoi TaxID=63787 RepID=A0A7N0V8P8_KALFE
MTELSKSLALIVLASLVASAASANFPWAKPNCSETCGNVTIPYPFGMGDRHCYLNPWFEITCNTTSSSSSATHSSRPFLSVFNLEVLNITLEGLANIPYVLVNSPVYSTCKDGSSWNSSDLSGSPFLFGSKSNRFVSVGCENTLLKNREKQVLAGCTSTCRGVSPSSSSGCYGINCCQTTIPSPLTFYALTSTSTPAINTSAASCTYSFLASEGWFQTNFSSSDPFAIIKNKDHVPVSLEWGIQRGDYPGGRPRGSGRYCMAYYNYYPGNAPLTVCWCSAYNYEGNPYIANGCRVVSACSKCNGRSGTVGGGGLTVILFIFCFWMYKLIKRRRELKMKKKFFKRNGGLLLQQQLSSNDDSFDTTKIFTAKELEKATDSFNISRVLGQGGQGTVYKGMLTDGKIVAVKKSRLVDEGQVEHFINEVVILSQINHRNIVKLLGCCLETEVPLLVYEFISNGTLSQLIRNQDDEVAREGNRDEIIGLAALARRCLNLSGKLRPTMKQVMFEIEQIRTSHIPSPVPQEFRHMKEEASLSPTSFSDYTGSPSDDSHHLLFNEKSTKSFGKAS